jgi:hypothetical protein
MSSLERDSAFGMTPTCESRCSISAFRVRADFAMRKRRALTHRVGVSRASSGALPIDVVLLLQGGHYAREAGGETTRGFVISHGHVPIGAT